MNEIEKIDYTLIRQHNNFVVFYAMHYFYRYLIRGAIYQ